MATPDELRRCVEQSPARVAVHDREGWLAIFADEGGIEDPVGSPAVVRSDGSLGRFWDTFIAPHGIRFEIRRDCFLGLDVMRDALIHTTIAPGVVVPVEAYLLYQMVEGPEGMRVRRMGAHWSLPHMTLVGLRLGPRGWVKTTGLTLRMLRVMGWSWFVGYVLSPFRGVGRAGARTVRALLRAARENDTTVLDALSTAGAQVETAARTVSLRELEAAAGGGIEIEDPVSAGRTVTFRYTVNGDRARGGLGLVAFDEEGRVTRVRLFTD